MCVSVSLCGYSVLLSDHLPPDSLQTHNVLEHKFRFAHPCPLDNLTTLGNPFSVSSVFYQPLPLGPKSRSRSSEEEPNQTKQGCCTVKAKLLQGTTTSSVSISPDYSGMCS